MTWPLHAALVLSLTGAFAAPEALDSLLSSSPDADATAEAAKVEMVPDERLGERIRQIYAEVDGLEEVSVRVKSGVVDLEGEVPSEAKRTKAVRLAASTPGVVDVVDETEITTQVWARVKPTLQSLEKKFYGLIARLPLLLVAFVVAAGFIVLAKLVASRDRLFGRLVRNAFVRSLLQQAVGTLIVILGLVTALDLLDATGVVGAILGAAGIVGLAIGFAFKDTVENYIASILMTLRQPFGPNDHMLIGDHEGRVVRLTSRATILMTLDGNHVRIPNADVFKSTMVNYSRNPRRRFQFDVGVGTTDDLVEATTLAVDTLSAMEGVMDDPKPEAQVLELGDSNVQVRVFGWVDQDAYDFMRVRSEAVRLVKTAFDDAKVSMPEPTYNVRLWDENQGFSPAKASPPAPPKVAPKAVRVDIRPDRNIERQVAEEQAKQQDLLDARSAQE